LNKSLASSGNDGDVVQT